MHQAWDSLSQDTLANCWLKADILPLLHTTRLRQNSGRYHHQCISSAIQDLCTLFKSTTLQSLDETASSTDFQQAEHMLGNLRSLCVQSTEDPDGLAAALEEWFKVEDSEIVRMDEIEMALEEEQQHSEESHCVLENYSPVADSETHSDDEEIDGESIQLNRTDILNRTDLDESLKMVKSLLHLTSSLQEDDTTNMLPKVYRDCHEMKKEKVTLNSRQTVIRDFFHVLVHIILSNLWTCKNYKNVFYMNFL